MDTKAHWEKAWTGRAVDEVSWYQEHPEPSVDLITEVSGPADPIIDIGGGASTLTGALLDAGRRDLTALDLSGAALAHLRARLGDRADAVRMIEADVLAHDFEEGAYVVWHDRAVFHFLTEDADRSRYAAQARRAVRPGGHVVLATFALDGPERCSGLPVRRHDADALFAALGEGFEPVESRRHEHRTPAGGVQAFTFVVARRG